MIFSLKIGAWGTSTMTGCVHNLVILDGIDGVIANL
jgi:hypothetical protein